MLPRTSPLRAYAMLVLVMLLWAGNSIVGRAVRDDIPPLIFAFGRWLGALLVLSPLALRRALDERKAIAMAWRPVLLLGLLGVAAFNAFLYSGLHFTTAANALLMQATVPPLVLLLGRLLFGDRARAWQVMGVILSTAGVVIIVFRGDPAAVTALRVGMGDALVLCGCVSWALYTICLRLRPAISPESFLFATFAIGVLAMAPLAGLEILHGGRVVWTLRTFAAFGYVAVFPSVTAYFLYNAAVTAIGPGPAGQTISVMPLFGALLAALLLDERLHAYHAVAMAMILTGVIVAGLAVRTRSLTNR